MPSTPPATRKSTYGANAASSSAAPPSRSGVSAAANAPEITVRSIRSATRVIVRFVLWSLADSKTTVGELRRYLADEAVDAFAELPGLLFKAWVSDDGGERWGASTSGSRPRPPSSRCPSRARELIGRDPDIAEMFDLEATVSVASSLGRLGLAFES